MSTVHTEHVLVIPTDAFHQAGYFQGFSTDVETYVSKLLRPELISYRPRGQMEEDPSFKQLIPYVIFRHTDHAGVERLFHYVRGQGNGETRLRSKVSIGIGGHISADDADVAGSNSPYQEGMQRELSEEVHIDTPFQERCVGMINDDETEVGKVHLGIVHIFDVVTQDVHSKEDDIAKAGFAAVTDLLQRLDEMESWSRICLEALFQ
ncbi:MAG: phosphoesterase [Planctomycetales bacterium]|nr:phosphoesterase [Planctomycetales bacterium]